MAAEETLIELARRIPRTQGLLAEHVAGVEVDDPGTDAVLVDQWGRAHPLARETTVGRDAGRVTIAILQSSISRQHAELSLDRKSERWRLRDLGSRNGVFVDGERLGEPRVLADRQLISFGDVGLVLLEDRASVRARPLSASALATEASSRGEGPRLRLLATDSAGGYAEVGAARVQLGSTQLALLQLLARRWDDEARQPEPVRGFVRSIELIAGLPWDTAQPEDNHVKQLVRRLRRALERAGLEDAIQSRHGFGYRLVIRPE